MAMVTGVGFLTTLMKKKKKGSQSRMKNYFWHEDVKEVVKSFKKQKTD